MHQLVHHWPQDHRPHIESAWIQLRNKLNKQQHPWYHVKGPMAATLTYLQEWGWTTHCLYQWTRYETAFMTEAHINLLDDWLTIEATLLQELQQQRTSRFAGKKNCQSLVSGLDWEVAKKASKKLSALQGKHVKTSITSKESGSNTAHCAKCQPHPVSYTHLTLPTKLEV